jgi:hypothetical protein
VGPLTLFDKSFIQMLNEDEAAIFDVMFGTVLCPIFLVETLADIGKSDEEASNRLNIVQSIARKAPVLHSYPNLHHVNLCLHELAGGTVEMSGRPNVAGGQPVRIDGKLGITFEPSPEAEAFERWQAGAFEEVERRFASNWRKQMEQMNHAAASNLAHRELRITDSAKNLASALAIAERIVEGNGQRYRTLQATFALLGLNEQRWPAVRDRWKHAGGPPLREFAPYTTYCLKVEILFHVAVAKKLISPDRISNKNDMTYLFYLPFCSVFVSNDKLHQRVAPLLLSENQEFILGQELKNDLGNLDEFYSNLPDNERKIGLFHLAAVPPNDESFLCTRIWKRFGGDVTRTSRPRAQSPGDQELLGQIKRFTSAHADSSEPPLSEEEQESVERIAFKRDVPLHRGKWRFMPPGVENHK